MSLPAIIYLQSTLFVVLFILITEKIKEEEVMWPLVPHLQRDRTLSRCLYRGLLSSRHL